ncbi:MAG: uracil-DNA glycosylase [Chthoniobacteraceae bacterium]|nr:uracil-DNA glycosylase [Chthoniobacteraceae bacterium]
MIHPFDQAVSLAAEALAGLRDTALPLPRASREALERLVRAPRAAVADATAPAAPVPEVPAPSALSAPEGGKAERLAALRERLTPCDRCPQLAGTRSNVVFGVGNPEAELMFVGEAPGADEDAQGEPFVGRAGQLLTKIIQAMGFQRGDVYIANVLKCRPDMPPGSTGNRKPRPEEMATCLPYLVEQIGIIRPRCLVALGSTAMEGLLGEPVVMRAVRGHWHTFQGIPLMATYHPAYLLRNQSLSEKRKVWEDMLLVLEKLGHPISAKQRGFFLHK